MTRPLDDKLYSLRLKIFILLAPCLLGFVATQPNLRFTEV